MSEGGSRKGFAALALYALVVGLPVAASAKEELKSSADSNRDVTATKGLHDVLRATQSRPVPDSKIPQTPAASDGQTKSIRWWTIIPSVLSALAWPLAALCIFRMALKAPQVEILLEYINRRTSQISIAGLEIKLSNGAEATIRDIKTLIEKVPETHQAWIHNTRLQDQLLKVIEDLRIYLTTSQPNHFNSIATDDEFKRFRFTLHVPDIVFSHSLRQLVNYLGCGRGGAGRLFSARRGIIGLAWRLQESQRADRKFNEAELITQWGMTRLEAKDTSGGATLLWAFVLKNRNGNPVGLLYADGKVDDLLDHTRIGTAITGDHAFEEISKMVARSALNSGLIDSLSKLEDARLLVTQLDIYEQTVK